MNWGHMILKRWSKYCRSADPTPYVMQNTKNVFYNRSNNIMSSILKKRITYFNRRRYIDGVDGGSPSASNCVPWQGCPAWYLHNGSSSTRDRLRYSYLICSIISSANSLRTIRGMTAWEWDTQPWITRRPPIMMPCMITLSRATYEYPSCPVCFFNDTSICTEYPWHSCGHSF